MRKTKTKFKSVLYYSLRVLSHCINQHSKNYWPLKKKCANINNLSGSDLNNT